MPIVYFLALFLVSFASGNGLSHLEKREVDLSRQALGMPGVLLFVLSCIVYGFAFDFFNISGALYVDQETEPAQRSSAQGLFMMMTNGFGATIGVLAAQAIVNHYCQYNTTGHLVGDWTSVWYIFAGFALLVAIAFALIFREAKK